MVWRLGGNKIKYWFCLHLQQNVIFGSNQVTIIPPPQRVPLVHTVPFEFHQLRFVHDLVFEVNEDIVHSARQPSLLLELLGRFHPIPAKPGDEIKIHTLLLYTLFLLNPLDWLIFHVITFTFSSIKASIVFDEGRPSVKTLKLCLYFLGSCIQGRNSRITVQLEGC